MEDLNKLLKDLTNYDPHIRQNAVRSLSQKYLDVNQRNALKEEDKTKIVTGLLSRLEVSEDSLEVKGCTVKNFGQISKFLKENEIIQIFQKIVKYIIDEKAVGKDIYVTCIKAILKEMSGPSCYTVGKILVPEVVQGLQSKNIEIKELCFDTLNDYLNTFNFVLIKESESVIKNKDSIFNEAINAIHVDNQSLRKTVSTFLGNFSVILNKSQMPSLLKSLIDKVNNSKDTSEKIAFLVALNSVAKNTANKHTEYIKTILPMIFQFSNRDYLEQNMHDYDANNDLVEAGLNLFETYVLNLGSQINTDMEKVVKTVLDLMEFDPNYVYDENEGDANADNGYGGEYDGWEGYEGHDAFVYGDDSSWKVRRAAVRVIQSFIKSRIELPKQLTEVIIQSLVFNLREHEENTKLDVIYCLSSFIRNLIIEEHDKEGEDFHSGLVRQKSMTGSIIPMIVKNLLTQIVKDLNQKNQKIKTATLQLLSSLALVGPNEIISSFDDLKSSLESCLNDSNNALIFFVIINRILKVIRNSHEVVGQFDNIINYIITGLKNDYYKVNIESLNVAFHLFRVLNETLSPSEYMPKIETLYDVILPKFKANDIDQELKMTLINVIGNMIMHIGHNLPQNSIDVLFSTYHDKTKNENLRPLIFNWLIQILKKNKNLKLEGCLSPFIPTVLQLLFKQAVHIQYQVLEFLHTAITVSPNSIKGEYTAIIEALSNMTNEESLLPLVYDNLSLVVSHFNIDKALIEKTLNNAIVLLDNSKSSAQNLRPVFLYIEKAAKQLDVKTVSNLLEKLVDFGKLNQNKAICISILAQISGSEDKLISICSEKLKSNLDDKNKKNVLLLLGEIALKSKTSHVEVLHMLEKMLDSSNDELKASVAVCIGKVGITDPKNFTDSITRFSNTSNLAYYYVSIREFLHVISEGQQTSISSDEITNLFKILITSAKTEDEKLRNLCGECLGLMATINTEILQQFIQNLGNGDHLIRSTFYSGLKYIFSSKQNLGNAAEPLIEYLIKGLVDNDLHVKTNAFNSLVNFAYNYNTLVRSRYGDLWNIFKKEHIINPDLIATVDIGGGMKIKNDKGLPIRKAIYSTLKILLELIPEKVNVVESLQMCLYGLDDNDDIQALCHGCLLKIAHFAPEAFISIIDTLVDNFKAKLDKVKKVQGETKVDTKKLNDLCIHVKRLFDELRKIHEIEENPKFVDLNNEVVADLK